MHLVHLHLDRGSLESLCLEMIMGQRMHMALRPPKIRSVILQSPTHVHPIIPSKALHQFHFVVPTIRP